MSVDRRRGMIEAVHADLSISAQCRLLSISRSSFYYAPQPESEETLALMRVIDASFLDMPWYGSRQMVRHLRRQGVNIGRRRVRRLMTKMGLSRDCRDFRVWAGIMGEKEIPYVSTQRTCDTERPA